MPQISKQQFFLALALVALLVAAVAFAFSSVASDSQSAATLPLPAHPDAKDEEPEIRKYILGLQREDFATYIHPEYGYSFSYPKDFIISTFKGDDSDVVVAEHPKLDFGFQIIAQPAGEEGAITKERISEGDPSIVVENPVEFLIDDETPALRFSSRDDTGRETREIWFIHAGSFYQITLHSAEPGRLDPWIRMLGTDFRFGSF
jgi:hypothetical protein